MALIDEEEFISVSRLASHCLCLIGGGAGSDLSTTPDLNFTRIILACRLLPTPTKKRNYHN